MFLLKRQALVLEDQNFIDLVRLDCLSFQAILPMLKHIREHWNNAFRGQFVTVSWEGSYLQANN